MPAPRARPPVHVAVDGLTTPLSRGKARRVVEAVLRAERVPNASISIEFVANRRIAAINRRYLRHRGATDVISLAYSRLASRDSLVGAIYIAPEVARYNASSNGIPVREEIVRLLVHGTLHVLGYDHPDGDGRERSKMWKRQERLVRRAMRAVA